MNLSTENIEKQESTLQFPSIQRHPKFQSPENFKALGLAGNYLKSNFDQNQPLRSDPSGFANPFKVQRTTEELLI